jgi:chromosomal replication initiation ATPase DnaA
MQTIALYVYLMTYTLAFQNTHLDETTKARIELIAQHQEVSPKSWQITCASVEDPTKLDLNSYMERCGEFFAAGELDLPAEEVEAYITWSKELTIYLAKTQCSASIAKVGEVFGMTKDETRAVQRRIDRTINKAQKVGDYDLLLLLNDLRKHVHGG